MRTSRHELELWVAPVILVVLHAFLFWSARGGALAGYADFSAFYGAGHILKDGRASGLYDYQEQGQVQAQLFSKIYPSRGPLFFNHPPFESVLFVPLAYLSYFWAYLVWTGFGLLVLFLLPLLLVGCLPVLNGKYRPFLLLSFLSFFPVFVAVLQGQDSVLLLLFFAGVFLALKRGHELRAGCLLALGLFKFQYVLPFLLPYVVKRRWRLLAGFSIVAAVLALVSLHITGWRGAVRYYAFLHGLNPDLSGLADESARATYPHMLNLRGLFDALGTGRFSAAHIRLAVVVASALLLLWSFARGSGDLEGEPEAIDLRFALNLSVALLVSYHLHLHDLSLLALPIVLVLNYLLGVRSPFPVVRWGLPVVSALFYLTPLYLLLLGNGRLHLLVWPLLLFAFGVGRELTRFEERKAEGAG